MSSLPSNMASRLESLKPVTVQPTDKLRVFKSHLPNVKYTFKDGTTAEFINHKFYTPRESQILELENEIRNNNQAIYVDPNEVEIVAEDRDPNVLAKKRVRAELIAEGWRKVDVDNDMGSSTVEFKPGNTRDVAAVAAGGNVQDGSKLAALAATLAAKAEEPAPSLKSK